MLLIPFNCTYILLFSRCKNSVIIVLIVLVQKLRNKSKIFVQKTSGYTETPNQITSTCLGSQRRARNNLSAVKLAHCRTSYIHYSHVWISSNQFLALFSKFFLQKLYLYYVEIYVMCIARIGTHRPERFDRYIYI